MKLMSNEYSGRLKHWQRTLQQDFYRPVAGIAFEGFIPAVPERVLSGGRYDKLMERMGRSSSALGFAIYLDHLSRLEAPNREAVTLVTYAEGTPIDKIRDRATGIYIAPRTRIVTQEEKVIHPHQVRVVRRMLRDYQNRGFSLRDTVLRAESVDNGEQRYIAPNKPNASIHIDTFHDYELCVLARYLREIPDLDEQLSEDFIAEHGLTDIFKAVRSVPPLQTDYVPKDSIVREFVGGSCFEY